MAITASPLWSGLLLLIILALSKLVALTFRHIKSPLGNLPGPKKAHWLYGNIREVAASSSEILTTWFDIYGPVMALHGIFGNRTLCTLDPKAINHILNHNDDFRRPDIQRNTLAMVLGEGVLFAEGDPHKRQRKIINPAFGPAQVRALTEIFNVKALELRDVWTNMITDDQSARVDGLSWLSKATLDIIGLAGFNYQFDAMNAKKGPNEFMQAFSTTFSSASGGGWQQSLRLWLPGWVMDLIPSSGRKHIRHSKGIMDRIGDGLLAEAKLNQASGDASEAQGRDILSLLVRANTDKNLPENQRLSDKEVLAQVPTFLVAGHETTSTATSWALYCLTQAPDVQRKLREELLEVSTDSPTMEELNNLPYFENFIREVLRLHSPVVGGKKEAMRDSVIPVETPFLDKNGMPQYSIRINKGDMVHIPIRPINRSKATWGEDALEFNPDRWDSLPEAAHHVPGAWGHQLTFSAGPRACIGYKFSLVETKALLFALVRAFEIELAVPGTDIGGSSKTLVTRPFVKSEMEKGVQLPLIIRPYLV